MTSRAVQFLGERRWLILGGLVFAVAWLVMRSYTTYQLVFPGQDRVVLAGPDGYHHLRHVNAVLENYPHLLRYDPMSTFPKVERGLNQGFYDLAVATVVKTTGGLLAPAPLLAWLSAVLAGLACLGVAGALVGLGRRDWAGLFLALMLFYPGPLRYMAVLGEGDHHAAEVLLAVLLTLVLHRALRPGAGPLSAGGLGLVMYLFAGTWAGAPMHMFLVVLALYAAAWLPSDQADRRVLARQGVVFGATFSGLTGLTWLLWPEGIIWTVGVGGMLALGVVATLAYAPYVWAVGRLQQRLSDGRKGAVLAVGLFLGCLALMAMHPAGRMAVNGLFEVRPADIAEHPVVSTALAWQWYGPLLFAFPFGCWLAVREFGLRQALAPLVMGAGLVFFWVRTHDFIYYAPVPVAVMGAYLLGRVPGSPRYREWAALGLCALPLLPGTGVGTPWVTPVEAIRLVYATEGVHQAGDWLRQVKSELVPDDAEDPYPYGLIGPWDLGNLLATLADTPVSVSQTHSTELAQLHFSPSTEGAYQNMAGAQKPARFLLIPARSLSDTLLTELGNAGLPISSFVARDREVVYGDRTIKVVNPTPLLRQTLIGRLYLDEFQGSDRFRLVYESPRRALRAVRIVTEPRLATGFVSFSLTESEAERLAPMMSDSDRVVETSRGTLVAYRIDPEVKVFEAVPGALLQGVGPPDSPVMVTLELQLSVEGAARTLLWRSQTDGEGRFELRLPYSTEGPPYQASQTVYAQAPYRIRMGDGLTAELQVPEDAVQKGTKIERDFLAPGPSGTDDS